MRGKGGSCCSCGRPVGITPACAGKSFLKSGYSTVRWDHPRVCGEKRCAVSCTSLAQGSPPRMRGKVGPIVQLCTSAGITPAYAGKSATLWHFIPVLWDHPRVCGEKMVYFRSPISCLGSPPHMRGKAEPEGLRQLSGGITPAYAGKRGARRNGKSRPQDHPRVCGEKHELLHVRTCELGSPPRVRGKASISVSSAHNGHQPKAIGLAAPHALTQQCPELFCIGHL